MVEPTGDAPAALRHVLAVLAQHLEVEQRVLAQRKKLVEHLDWPDTWVISASIHLRTIHHTAGGGGGGWPFVLRSGWEWWRGLKGTALTHGE